MPFMRQYKLRRKGPVVTSDLAALAFLLKGNPLEKKKKRKKRWNFSALVHELNSVVCTQQLSLGSYTPTDK